MIERFCVFCNESLAAEDDQNWVEYNNISACVSCICEVLPNAIEAKRDVRDCKKYGRSKLNLYTLMELPPQSSSVFFVVDDADYAHNQDQGFPTPEFDEFHRHHLESHTCPVNFLRIPLIATEGDLDPHGLMKYIRSVEYTECPSCDSSDFWIRQFPELDWASAKELLDKSTDEF